MVSYKEIRVSQVIEVDQIFVIKVLLRLSWVNEFFKWHPEEGGTIAWIKMLPEEVWTPDIVPYNDMDTDKSEHQDKYKKQITVHSDGRSRYYFNHNSYLYVTKIKGEAKIEEGSESFWEAPMRSN